MKSGENMGTLSNEDTFVNPVREEMGLMLLIDLAKEFYEDPKNQSDFEAWKAEKQRREAG